MPRERKRKRKKGRERYWEQVRELADEHGWSITEAREQWSRFYKKGGKRRRNPRPEPIDPIVLIDAAPTEGPTCPYCRVGFLDHEETSVCSGCQTRLHAECRAELSRCPTIGCRGASRNAAQTVAPTGPITITIEPDQLPAVRRRRVVRNAALTTGGLAFLAILIRVLMLFYG